MVELTYRSTPYPLRWTEKRTMAEPFFRMMEMLVPPIVALNGNKITFEGLENIPEHGGALVALNHTSYVDWIPASIAAKKRRRRLRFMIKAELQEVRAVNYVIKHAQLIPVDRSVGGDTGAPRMALEAQVPIIPLIVWGAHRIWPKGHPKKVFRNRVPITVAAGSALQPEGDVAQLNVALRRAMNSLLYQVQEGYPRPQGEYWVPRRLGGSGTEPGRLQGDPFCGASRAGSKI